MDGIAKNRRAIVNACGARCPYAGGIDNLSHCVERGDAHLPRLDGLRATRAIRAWESRMGLPRSLIVGTTASVAPRELDDCLRAGMDQVLAKPVVLAALFQLVREARRRKRVA